MQLFPVFSVVSDCFTFGLCFVVLRVELLITLVHDDFQGVPELITLVFQTCFNLKHYATPLVQ